MEALCIYNKWHPKGLIKERFSPNEVEVCKSHLCEFCRGDLEAHGLSFHVRRDSDKRSQLAVNLDDTLSTFDALIRSLLSIVKLQTACTYL